MPEPGVIRHNFEVVRARIAEAERRAGRPSGAVRLLAVSKTQPAEVVQAALACGQAEFGENYAQELRDKSNVVTGAAWHFIGPLQENKVNLVVGRAACIHTLSREKILRAVERRAASLGIVQDVLVQVNLGGEPQKNGLEPAELGTFLALFGETLHVRCRGLMTLPPFDLEPEAVRPHFAALARLLGEFRGRVPGNVMLEELSMGMSGDFEVAIAEGATWVRVGSALFGPRLPRTGGG
jgi:PLP dependent protein